jgi:hypothetical protein
MKWTRPLAERLRGASLISGSGEIIRPQEASPMAKNLRVLGSDMAKQIFSVAGMDETGKIVLRTRLTKIAI